MRKLLLLSMVLLMVASVSALPSKICYPLSTGLFCFNSTDVSGLSIVNGLDSAFSTNGLMVKTAAGTYTTVDNNSTRWNTAYGWGNHASAGYAAQTTLLNVNTTLLAVIAAVNGTALKSVPYQSGAAGWTNTTTETSTLFTVRTGDLTLNETASNTATLRINSLVNNDQAISFYEGATLNWQITSDNYLNPISDAFTIRDKNTEQFVIAQNGNIGLGFSNPQARIHVNGSGIFNGSIIANGNVSASYFFGNLNASYVVNEPWTTQIAGKAGVPSGGFRLNTFDGVRQGEQSGSTFDGINDHINSSDSSTNISYPFGITVCAWTISQQLATKTIVGQVDPGFTKGFEFDVHTSYQYRITLRNATLDFTTTANQYALGELVFACFTYNNSDVKFFKNGSFVTNKSGVSDLTNLNNKIIIGARTTGTNQNFNGSIFKVVVWNRSLSAGEVAAEYALGANTPTTLTDGLVLQYLLNRSEPEFSNSTHVFNVLGATRTEQTLAEQIIAVNTSIPSQATTATGWTNISGIPKVTGNANITGIMYVTNITGDGINPTIYLSNFFGSYMRYSTNYYQAGSSSLMMAIGNSNKVVINSLNTTFSNVPVSKNFTLSNETGQAYCIKVVGATLTTTLGGC